MKMMNQFWYLWQPDRKLFYDPNKNRWVSREEYTGNCFPAAFRCRSYLAAKRHLKYHDEIPVGMSFCLVSKFIGADRYLIKRKGM